MAKYTGYVTLPHGTYEQWRLATNLNGFDADGAYGCQCYDLVLEFWYNVGFPQGYPVSGIPGQGNTGNAYDIWTYRQYNVSYNGVNYFDLITNLDDVQKGDILIYDQFSGNPYGHVGFADEDYSSWHAANPGSYEFPILSENNGGFPDPLGGAYTNIHGYDTRLFLGAFRYKEWHIIPPTTVKPYKRHRFKWILYARKLRQLR